MATNWDAILSNTNNLQDVLSILKKVLASLDIKADITTIDEALAQINSLDADVQEKLSDVTAAITKFNNTGGFISAPTLTALQAITPEYDYQLARVDATGDEYRWNPALTTTVKWEPTGRNFLSESKAYTDSKSGDAQANAEQYTDTLLVNLSSELSDFLPPPDQDFGYVNITTSGEVDFVKKLYVSGTWAEGSIYLDYLQKQSNGTQFSLYFRNASNGVIAGNNTINESDFTGVKTYIVNNDGAVNVAGFSVKIQIDWSKYNALAGGISKNRYVKNIAKSDFTSTSTNYQKKQDEQDARLTAQESSLSAAKTDLSKYLPPALQDFGYVNITTAGEVDFVKKLYVASNPAWSAGSVYLDYLQKQSNGTQFAIYFRNASNTILLGNNVNETDYTGVKTYTIPAYGSTGYTGKIQIDWSKYNPIGSGISKNRYVKEAARIDFTTGSAKSIDDTHEDEQDARLTNLENSVISQPLIYKRFINQSITTTDFQTNGTGWTLSGGIAVCNEVSETTKLYAKQKYISNKIEHRWTLQLKANSVIKLGGFVGATYIETTCVIDCVNKKLIINRAGDNSAAATTPRASVTIPFNIVDDREYYVVLHRNNRKNSIKLVDSVTAQSVTATDDWSSVGYTIGSGNMRSYPYITLSAGTSITVKKYENYLPFGVDVVFGGDSNTESSQDVSGVYQVNWADNLMTSVFKENGIKFAEFGIGFSGWWACINEVIAMKPKYFIVNIGTNGATSQANYQQIVDMCAANNIELILCHNPRDDGSRTYLTQNNLNIDATGVRTVKFDIATSINNDLAQAYNSAYYKDAVHLNTVGYKALSDRFLAEIPMLKSN